MKEILLVLIEALVHHKQNLVLILVTKTQSFARVQMIMLIIIICLLMEKKSLSLKPTTKMLTFQLKFNSEVYLIDLVLLSLEKNF